MGPSLEENGQRIEALAPLVARYLPLADQDTDFTWEGFQARNDNELGNNFGNLINRVFAFTHKYFAGRVPAWSEAALSRTRAESDHSCGDNRFASTSGSRRSGCAYASKIDGSTTSDESIGGTVSPAEVLTTRPEPGGEPAATDELVTPA